MLSTLYTLFAVYGFGVAVWQLGRFVCEQIAAAIRDTQVAAERAAIEGHSPARTDFSKYLTTELLLTALRGGLRHPPDEQTLFSIVYGWTSQQRREVSWYLTDVLEYGGQLSAPFALLAVKNSKGFQWWVPSDFKESETDVSEHAVQSSVVVPAEDGVDVSAAATDVRCVDESRSSDSIAGDRPLDGSGCDEN